jgi:hypothetical protein
MKHAIMSIEQLARPMNAACYQAFSVEANVNTGSLFLVYQGGKSLKKVWVNNDLVLLGELIRNPTIREWFLELYGVHVDLDPMNSYFADHMVHVVAYLSSEYGAQFMLLRGSEVSLDHLVQLQSSSPASSVETLTTR